RVLHVARRMIARDVERLEVVIVGLDLGPLGHREAEAGEDRDDLVVNARQRMERSLRRPAAGKREVESPAPALDLALDLEGRGEPGVQERLQLALALLGRRAALIRTILSERAARCFCLRPRYANAPALNTVSAAVLYSFRRPPK